MTTTLSRTSSNRTSCHSQSTLLLIAIITTNIIMTRPLYPDRTSLTLLIEQSQSNIHLQHSWVSSTSNRSPLNVSNISHTSTIYITIYNSNMTLERHDTMNFLESAQYNRLSRNRQPRCTNTKRTAFHQIVANSSTLTIMMLLMSATHNFTIITTRAPSEAEAIVNMLSCSNNSHLLLDKISTMTTEICPDCPWNSNNSAQAVITWHHSSNLHTSIRCSNR